MWWMSHILQNTLGLSYNQLPVVLLEIYLDAYTLGEVLLLSLGKGSIGSPHDRHRCSFVSRVQTEALDLLVWAYPEEAFLNSVVSSCSSSSLRMKIPRESAFSPELEKEALVDWQSSVHIGSCRDFSPSQPERSSQSEETWGHVRGKGKCHILS